MKEKISLSKKCCLLNILFLISSLILLSNTKVDYEINEEILTDKNSYSDVTSYLEEIDSYIKEYSKYFNFDEEKIIKLVREITNNYKSDYKLKIYGEEFTFEDPKNMSLLLVYNIYRTPKTYNINKNNYIKSKKVTKPKYNSKNKIVISTDYTFSEYVGYISELFNVDKSLALAISDYETGYQKSSLAKNKNNFGGLRGSNGYITYPTPEAGIICYVSNLKRIMYKNKVTNLTDLSGIYVNGKKNKPSTSWVNNITSIQNKINKNKDKYFKI